jgi:hypothetical protein
MRKVLALCCLAACGQVAEPEFAVPGDIYRSNAQTVGIQAVETFSIVPTIAHGLVRPVSFVAIGVCDAAAAVLGHALQTAYSCTPGQGRVSMYFPQGSGAQLLEAFRLAVEAGGGSMAYREGQIVVVGGSESSYAGGGEVGFADGAEVPVSVAPPTQLLDVIAGAGDAFPELVIERAPPGVAIDDVETVASDLGANLRAFLVRDAVWLAYTRSQASEAVVGVLSAGRSDAIVLPVAPDDIDALRPLLEQFATVSVASVSGGVAVSGPRPDVLAFLSSASPLLPYRRDFRIEAAFLSYETSRRRGASVDVSGAVQLSEDVVLGVAAQAVGIGVVLDAAISNGSASVISRPSLVVSDRSSATFRSGAQVPIRSALTQDGVTSETIEFRDVGITLTVAPVALSDGVRLDVTLVVSSVSDTSLDGIPIFNSQSYSGSVVARIGEVLVISGLTDETRDRRRSVGALLGGSRNEARRQLQILLTVN